MQFASQPVNLEPLGGGPLCVQIALSGAVGASVGEMAVWAARLPCALSVPQITALASGTMPLGATRQDGPLHGLRRVQGLSLKVQGDLVLLSGSLFQAGQDMPPRVVGAPSWDVNFQALLERTDGPWSLAVTRTVGGVVTVAAGGLGQWTGQEHLAGVFLGPSNVSPEYEVGVWLQETITSLKPVLDARMAQVADAGQDLSLKAVAFTDERQPDVWPTIYIVPQSESDDANGLSAPDRRNLVLQFALRCQTYGDTPDPKVRSLTQLAGTLKQLLNTRKLRRATMPSGLIIDMAHAGRIEYGQTSDSFDDAADIVWSCTYVQTGIF